MVPENLNLSTVCPFNNGISIITIVLNGETFIEGTILSVIEQKKVNIEYIIIDGGSTDGTLKKISIYRDRINLLISEPDKGIYYAINKGISFAKYNLIGLIHCGDFYEPNVLSVISDEFQRIKPDVIYGDVKIIEQLLGKTLTRYSKSNHNFLRKRMSIFHPATFISRECYDKNGVYDANYKIAADYDLFLHLYLKGVTFHYIPMALANFRGGGVSGTMFKLLFRENFIIRKKHLGILYACFYAITKIPVHLFYNFRKSFIETIIGKRTFMKLKRYIINRTISGF